MNKGYYFSRLIKIELKSNAVEAESCYLTPDGMIYCGPGGGPALGGEMPAVACIAMPDGTCVDPSPAPAPTPLAPLAPALAPLALLAPAPAPLTMSPY